MLNYEDLYPEPKSYKRKCDKCGELIGYGKGGQIINPCKCMKKKL